MMTRCAAGLAGAALLACASGAGAADRMVMYEQFTASWCGYCPPVGQALNYLMQDNPEDVAAVQIHTSGTGPQSWWGNGRVSFYNVSGIPHVRIDGLYTQNGSQGTWQQNYASLESRMNARLGVYTDLAIEIVADPYDDAGTYDVDINLTVEPDGEAKDVRVHLVDCHYNFPAGGDKYHNGVINGWNLGDVSLVPGVTTTLEQRVTFNAESWADKDDIRLVAFAQDPRSTPPAEVYNAKQMAYPFVPPIPTIEHQVVEVPIPQAAIDDDPTLAGAKTIDLQVIMTEDDDWTASGIVVTTDGTFYQHPVADDDIPQPVWWSAFPSLEYDTFFSAFEFAAPGFAEGPFMTDTEIICSWFDTVDNGPATYTTGRFTVVGGTTLTIVGDSTAKNTGGKLHHFEFTVDLTTTPCEGDLNGDGERNLSDLGILLASFEVDDGGDINGDGETNLADLGALLAVFDIPCP
jgi:thiol-disulfide isomerase/thioredoxin